jgi:hypothetical protein
VDGHPWGDDWAGYVLQSRALVAGAPGAELDANAAVMRAGDIQIGPDAYPWGYPLLLGAAAIVLGDSIEAYKWLGVLALVVLIVSAVSLAGLFLPPIGAAFVGIATVFQPSLFSESGFLGSDLPFVAVSTAAVWLSFAQWARLRVDGRYRGRLTVGIALLSIAAFSFRSNGVVVIAVYVGAILMSTWHLGRNWVAALRQLVHFGAVLAAGLGIYFSALPDGSLSTANYLSFDPRVWAEGLIRHFHYIASWPTFDLLRGPLKLVPFLLFASMVLVGWWRLPAEGSVLVAYVGAHLGLITVFPFDGGVRYYYPMLVPAMVLFAIGVTETVVRLSSAGNGAVEKTLAGPRWIGVVAVGGVLIVGVGAVRAEQQRIADMGPDAPFGEAFQEASAFVSLEAPSDARIGFFKPRAFRLLSGRVAYAIHDPGNLGRVDWYVFNAGTTDARTQVPEAALLDPRNGFRIVREISPFRVYARTGGGGSETIAAPERGLP